MIMVAAAAAVACGTPAAYASTGAAHSAAAPTTWGTAEVVPGTAALNTQGNAGTSKVSCPSTGNCAVAGTYRTLIKGRVHTRPFVDTQTNGKWHSAKQVPGITALGRVGTVADVQSLSCASAGNCAVTGYYYVGPYDNNTESYVASETNGTWGAAQEIAGGLPTNSDAQIQSVSCGAPGDCSAGGAYYPAGGGGGPVQAFVVSETGGTWGTAEEVPGTAALNAGDNAQVNSVSCSSAGNCSAGGYYASSTRSQQAFVVSETGGTWGMAQEVPGTATLNSGDSAQLVSVSCSSAGNCSAGGDYATSAPSLQAFVVKQTDGTWSTARQVPGLAALNTGDQAQFVSVSCSSAGNCSAGGYYYDTSSTHNEPFVVNQTHGTWGKAQEVPGIAALYPTSDTFFSSVSCAAAGDCSAVGSYSPASLDSQMWVVSETGGTWGPAEAAPGTGGGAFAGSVSCASATRCVAGGSNPDGSGDPQAIILSSS
jgi:hypothetical protein